MCIIMQSVPTGLLQVSGFTLRGDDRGEECLRSSSQDSRTIHYHGQGAAGHEVVVVMGVGGYSGGL